MEYERLRQEDTVQRDASQEAFREFVAGLQVMSTDFDRHVQNFAWCAGQIVGDPDASAQIRGMMEFALRLQEFGLESALDAVRDNSGVSVRVTISESRTREKLGIVVGIVGARYVNKQKVFDGVAVMENSRGQEAFVRVGIRPNGETFLQQETLQTEDPETVRLMRELYPKARK